MKKLIILIFVAFFMVSCVETVYVDSDSGRKSHCPPPLKECVCNYCGGDGYVWGACNWGEGNVHYGPNCARCPVCFGKGWSCKEKCDHTESERSWE